MPPAQHRTPPNNQEAERALLGAMLLNPDAAPAAFEALPGDPVETFYNPQHATLFRAMRDLFAQSQPIDGVTLLTLLVQRNELDAAGGPAHIAELTRAVPTSANLMIYAAIVRDCALARGLITTCTRIATEAYDSETPAAELLHAAEAQLFALGNDRLRAANSLTRPAQSLEDALAAIEHKSHHGGMAGLPTGLPQLDAVLCGLKPAELVIVAARPSVGKTAIALHIALHLALHQRRPVAFFSLEMAQQQLCERMLINAGGVDSSRLNSGFLAREQITRAAQAAKDLSAAPVYIDDTPSLSPMALRAKARRLAAQLRNTTAGSPAAPAPSSSTSGAPQSSAASSSVTSVPSVVNSSLSPIIIVDYLQLMGIDGKKAERRDLDVAEASRALKALAKELQTTVIALCQLSRAAEQGGDNARPRLSHLRESGAIEQDADAVLLLSKLPRHDIDDRHTVRVLLDLAKNRNGATGEARALYRKNTQRWEPWPEEAEQHAPAPQARPVPNTHKPRTPYTDDDFDHYEEEELAF